jgi:hypothetical protein
MKQCTYCGKEYPDEASVCAIDQEPLRVVMPPPPVAPASPVMIAPNITRGMRKLFATPRAPNLVRQHEKKKEKPSGVSVMRNLFAILFSVLAIFFSIGGAGALFDHVIYAYHLGTPGGYGGDSDAYGSFFGTGFSFIAFVFALINFFIYPRSKVGVIILVWCCLLVLGFTTLRPRF